MKWRVVRGWAGAAALALLTLACRTPTQVTVDIATDVDCPDLDGTTMTVGEAARVEGKAPVASTTACTAGLDLNPIGSIVVIPSDENDAEFGLKVVAGVDKPAETCVEGNSYDGCIVARRAMRFVPHEELHLPVALRGTCKDVPCTATTTCVLGRCVDAAVDDPAICVIPGACDEGTLGSGGGGGAGGGGGGGAGGGYALPQAECGRPSVLTDDFDDPSRASQWILESPLGTSAEELGGELALRPAANSGTPREVRYRSHHTVNLDEDLIRVKASSGMNASTDAYAYLAAELDAGRRLVIEQRHDKLWMRVVDGGQENAESITYDPVQHRWWQLREEQGMIRWETSPDGIAWTERRSTSTPSFASTVYMVLGAGTPSSIATPGEARFDDFNRARPQAVWCPATTFQDDFEDGNRSIAWVASTNVGGSCSQTEAGGLVQFSMDGVNACTSKYQTGTAFDLTGNSITVDVPAIFNYHAALYVYIAAEDDQRNRIEFGFKGTNEFFAGASSDNQTLKATGVPYVPDERHWRIREAGGTVFFEASADGSQWSEKTTFDPPFAVTGMHVSFGVNVSGPMGKTVGIGVPSYNGL